MSMKKSIKEFGKEAAKAIITEFTQSDEKQVFRPQHPTELTRKDMRKSLRLIMFIKKKRCGRIKARKCADGRPQRGYIPKENATSPTVAIDALFLISIIDVKENRCVATCDIDRVFLQMLMRTLTHVKLTGKMAELMVQSNPGKYKNYLCTGKNGE